MRRGDFAAAHRVSDAIRATPSPDRASTPRHEQRIWGGEPIEGRRVLVRCHHGLGDSIQFARFLPLVADRARAVTVCAQSELLPLFTSLDSRINWLPLTDDDPVVDRDVDIEIMELLQLFRVEPHSMLRRVPYLQVPHAPPAPSSRRPAVGLVWSAGTWVPQRSMNSEQLAPLLAHTDVSFHSLQHGAHVSSHVPGLIVHPQRAVSETAAEMLTLDLVITVDSMPAHLAGALGRPVWTLLPFESDWRWLEGRDDSPWYPTMRLFRQTVTGDWDTVVERVGRALEVWRGTIPK